MLLQRSLQLKYNYTCKYTILRTFIKLLARSSGIAGVTFPSRIESMALQDAAASGEVLGRNYTTALDSFPELWTEILRRVPQADRLRSVPLVSRRFNEACRDPCLWSELSMWRHIFQTEAHWRCFLRWLAARASGLQTLVFAHAVVITPDLNVWERRMPELLALLAASAPQLRSLEHQYPEYAPGDTESALPADVGRLSQLTSLRMGFQFARVTTAQVDATVQKLPSLQHLTLQARWATILSDGFPISITTSCSQLRHLDISGGKLGALPPELGRLGSLTRLALPENGIRSLPDSISQLSALVELDLSFNFSLSLPPGLTACRQLTRLVIDRCEKSPVLARLHSLRYLSVRAATVQRPYWTQLTALTELQLLCKGKGAVPAGLGAMTGLRKLYIMCAELDDLPAGPFLGSLESLCMEQCTLKTGVPPALAGATKLRYLDLRIDIKEPHVCSKEFSLSRADVALLSALPALRTLSLKKPTPAGQQMLEECVAQLQAACIAQGRAPPAVMHVIKY